MNRIYIAFLLLVLSTTLSSQIIVTSPYDGNQTHNISAPEYIRMLPGYSYSPSTSNYLRAFIDPNASVILPLDYTENPVDPETRELDLHLPVGSTSGQASVSLTGGATYTIPIFAPPGTAGMQPNISLVYNSQSGNGIAGYGWNIVGLSAITRVQHTIYHDGSVECVDFIDDRFSLDGQRLISKTGEYGAISSTYYTEVFNGSLITIKEMQGGGPKWFEVVTKDGSRIEYGNTDDSRFKSQLSNEAIIAWNINKITDANGNYIEFIYRRSNLECYISEINYTGNASDPNNIITAYNSIKFYYKDRTDKSNSHIAGSRIEQNVLLDHIDIKSENITIKTYRLKQYFDFYSKLNEVEEYGKDNCKYNTTVFGYDENDNIPVVKSFTEISPDESEILYGDFDGDGLTDIYYAEYPGGFQDDKWSVFLNEGNSTFNESDPDWTGDVLPNRSYSSSICDLNGDGKSDIILLERFSELQFLQLIHYRQVKCLISTGVGFHSFTLIEEESCSNEDSFIIYPIDLDGDSKDEFCMESYKNRIDFYKTDFSGSSVIVTELNNLKISVGEGGAFDRIHIIELNGDGAKDMLITSHNSYLMTPEYSEIFTFVNNNGFYSKNKIYDRGYPTRWHNVYPGDYNGDGITDLLTRVKDNNNEWHWNIGYWTIPTYTGGVFTEVEIPSLSMYADDLGLGVNDFNNDGKTDLILQSVESFLCPGGVCAKLAATPLYCNNDVFFSDKPINVCDKPLFYVKVINESLYNRTIDFNGDGINDYTFLDGISVHSIIILNPEENKNGILAISNGLNYINTFHYTTLSNSGVYSANSTQTFPLRTIRYPLRVVDNYSSTNGLDAFSTSHYKYKDAILHLLGKGFLGFKEIGTSSNISPIINNSTSEINSTHYFLYPVETSSYKYDDFMNEVDITNTSYVNQVKTNFEPTNKVFLPYQESIAEKDFATNFKKTTEISIDQWGNPLLTKISSFASHTSTSPIASSLTESSNYIHAGASEIPSKPQDIILTQSRTGELPYIKKVHFEYLSSGNVDNSTDFYGQDSAVVTRYTEYVAGLPKVQTTSIPKRGKPYFLTTTNTFDTKYRYIASSTDAENFVSSATYDVFGNKLTITDANELTVINQYDGFGRLYKKTDPLGVWAKSELKWYTGIDKPNVSYYSETTSNNATKSIRYFDKLGRVLYSAEENPQKKMVYIKTIYNEKGLVTEVSEPYFENESPTQFTSTVYNDYNQPQTINLPTGVILTYISPTPESPNTVSSVYNSATLITTSKTIDATGKVILASDPGGAISYEYYSHGNPKAITAPDGSQVSMTYDAYARQLTLSDPDAGTIEYLYNALGELQKQKDAEENEFTMTYNKTGQLLSKIGNKSGITTKLTNTYHPVGAEKGSRGLLVSSEYKDEDVNTTKYIYTYNAWSQITQKTIQADQTFTYFYTYDTKGNLDEYTFPSGYVIKYQYDPDNGSLLNVMDKTANKTIYVPGEFNARGQTLDYTNSGGTIYNTTSYDSYGMPATAKCGTSAGGSNIQSLETHFNACTSNLEYRKDNMQNLTETFTYDPLHKDRLASWQVNGQPQYSMTYSGNNGNILTKSDFTSSGNPYTYYGLDKPHAVRSIKAPLQLPAEASQHITYSQLNKVSEINHTSQGLRYTIAYGPDEQRIKSQYYITNALQKTKYYIGGDYETEINSNGTSRKLHYLPGGGLYVIDQNGTGIMYYVLTDYQGNWCKTITETGTTVERYSFDPWGRRRHPDNWNIYYVPTTYMFDRGYTGHEMLDAFGLINMNGRVYDPIVARFLSPDNYVQSPDNSGGFNRYSYCLNNPLKYTDPDGNNPLIVAAVIVGAITGTINLVAHRDQIDNFWDGAAAFGIGFGAGFIGTVSGGTAFAAAGGAASGAGGFIAGSFGSGMGTIFSSQVQSMGNSAYFGDPMMTGKQFLTGVGFSALTGGLINGSIASIYGRNFWNGTLPPKTPSITRLSFPTQNHKAEIQPNNGRAEIHTYNSNYNSPTEIKMPNNLNYYTPDDPSEWTSIGIIDDKLHYLTPNGELSRYGAKIELAAPRLPNFKIEIPVSSTDFDPTKLIFINRVQGNQFGAGGGGWEIVYKGILNFDKTKIIITPLP